MQIQRIQSVFLLLAFALMVVFIFVPFGFLTLTEGATQVLVDLKAVSMVGVLLPAGIGAVLYLLDIFLFNNLKLQKTVLIFAIMMTVVTAGIVCYVNFDHATQGTLHWGGGGLLLVAVLIAAFMANGAIRRDEKLLRSYDRLR